MSSINPEEDLTPAEIDNLDQLEAIVQPGLDAYVDVGDALAEIRDRHLYRESHPSFETYVRDRWGIDTANGHPLSHKGWDPWDVAEALGDELVPTLRWLLTKTSGTIGTVAHQLEHRAVEIDDGARDQLRDDVLVVDDELATVKALLIQLTDWDAELERLLDGELPPFAADEDPQDDD